MDKTKWLEDLYAGNADRRQADKAERLSLLAYQSARDERSAIAGLFGQVIPET